jgi:hypothetical protein
VHEVVAVRKVGPTSSTPTISLRLTVQDAKAVADSLATNDSEDSDDYESDGVILPGPMVSTQVICFTSIPHK